MGQCLRDLSSGQAALDPVAQVEQVAEGYRAMDERRAIKTLLRP
jgi:hypothetical protein